MLRFFRINDPYRLLGVLLVLILVSLPFLVDPVSVSVQELKSMILGESIHGRLMYVEVYDNTPPLAAIIHGLTDNLFGRSLMARHISALVILFFQAAFFAILLINNKAYTESSYVPSLIFAVLSLFSVDMLSFSPELLASTVLLLALNNLFKEIEFTRQHDEYILNLGVYLGLATLVIFTTYVFLIGTIVILVLSTRVNLRRMGLLLFGFILPHALVFTYYFYKGEAGFLWTNFYGPNLLPVHYNLMSLGSISVLFALPFLFFVLSLITIGRDVRLTKYQSQLVQVMFLWLVVAVIYFFITPEKTAHSLVFILPPLAFLISHYMLHIRRKWLAEFMLWFFVIGLGTISLMARYGKLSRVSYAGLYPKTEVKLPLENQRILVLGNDTRLYRRNKLATGFLNWELTREVFENPEYFEHDLVIEASFRSDLPQVIVDEQDLMKAVFKKIPGIKSKYRREGIFYKLIPSN